MQRWCIVVGCGAGQGTVRRAPAGRARSLSAPIRRRAVTCRAVGPSDLQTSLPSVESFREKLSNGQTGGSASQATEQLQSTLTDLTSSAVARSKDIFDEANSAVGDKLVPSVKQLSSQLTEQLSGASGAASSASADLLSRSSEIGSQATDKLLALSERFSSSADPAKYAGQFTDLSDKVLSLTSELTSKSSDVSTQFSSALEQQLASLPELKERFAAGADAFVQNVNSTSSKASGVFNSGLNGVTDTFEDNLGVLKGLLASGQAAEVLATPEAIGAVTVATLFLVTIVQAVQRGQSDKSAVVAAATKRGSTAPVPQSTASKTTTTASTTQQPVSDAVSARAWIDNWRSSQVPLQLCRTFLYIYDCKRPFTDSLELSAMLIPCRKGPTVVMVPVCSSAPLWFDLQSCCLPTFKPVSFALHPMIIQCFHSRLADWRAI